MKVFVTGASGWIASKVIPELISHGHTITGLARSPTSISTVTSRGATPISGSLQDLSILAKGASEADAVIHLGFVHDFSTMEAFARSISIDAKAIEAMGQALAKNDSQHKIFIGTSGTLHLKPNGVGTEEDAGILEGPTSGRRKNEQVVLKMKDQGIKSNVVRLSPTCHGKGDEGFSALLVGVAKLTGVSAYPDDGSNVWPAVHASDVGVLYRLVLEKGLTNKTWHAVAETVSLKSIAEVISTELSLPTKSIPKDQAASQWGMLGPFAICANNPVSSEITRKELGWEPKEMGLLEDVGQEWYLNTEGSKYGQYVSDSK